MHALNEAEIKIISMKLFICHVKHWLYVVLMMINLVFSLAFYRTLSGTVLITTAILLIFTRVSYLTYT
jgi:hypothetical protein